MATAAATAFDTGGYPKEIFKDGKGFDAKFLCNQCKLILREPVQAFCGHRFCKACIEPLLRDGKSFRCQQCEREDPDHEASQDSMITSDQIYPDNGIKREMSKLKVVCTNQGCSWAGGFKQYEEHFVLCEFKSIKCPGCGNWVNLNRFAEHQNIECTSSCEKCKNQVLTKFMQDHLDQSCSKAVISCTLCGKAGIVREHLQRHQQSSECQSQPVTCPVGCGLIERREFQEHFRRMHHEIWLVQHLEKINQTIERLSARNGAPEVQDQIVARVTQIDDKITALERQTSELAVRANSSSSAVGIQGTENIDTKIRQAVELQIQSVNERLDVKAGTFEGISSALHRELEKTITAVEKLERYRQEMASVIEQNQNKIRALERSLSMKDLALAELELKMQSLEAASFDGTFMWRVPDFSKKHQDALHGRTISIYSPPFYTTRRGYKMCARLYANGDGMGKGSHLSLFFVVMRGNFDPLLKWPFSQRVTFCLVNQNGGEHVIDSFRPDPQSSSFRRPTSDMNIASGCPLFIRLEMLQNTNNGFLKDDTLYLKIEVDVSDLSDPISTFEERVKPQS